MIKKLIYIKFRNNQQNKTFEIFFNYLFDDNELYLIESFILYKITINFKHNIVIKINVIIYNFIYIVKKKRD